MPCQERMTHVRFKTHRIAKKLSEKWQGPNCLAAMRNALRGWTAPLQAAKAFRAVL